MKRIWLPGSMRLSMELVIVIALTLGWMPWVLPARAAIPGWDNTGAMGTARFAHTATLLGNGKVLIAGGAGAVALSSAELYTLADSAPSGSGGGCIIAIPNGRDNRTSGGANFLILTIPAIVLLFRRKR